VTGLPAGSPLTVQAAQTEPHNLKLVGSAGIDFFTQTSNVFGPPELFFGATSSTPGVASLSNASSRQWNWNLNAIEAYSPAGGGFKATTSAGVQVEDREIERSRVVAQGLLPGQSNIDQGSLLGRPVELTPKARPRPLDGLEECVRS